MTNKVRLGCLCMPALLAAALAVPCIAAPGSPPFVRVGGTLRTLTPAALTAAQKGATRGQVSPDGKTLTFGQRAIRLVATTGPAKDMLSYRLDGLRNPTLVVPKGASLRVLFVNTDDDMTHNLRFGPQHASAGASVGTLNLAHRTETALHAAEATLRAPSKSGSYYYLCTIPGHAPGGMWGTVRVR